ncbi:hypothetical protein H243_3458 [Klebsiella pneumoniae UHKPC04]|nr:hypothetical protein P244_3064 [Klebsiella pneumoniae HK787]AUB48495.1 hypothetical protein SGH10_003130 [Klebsiella pneumoniae]EOY69323.1 hypothetical protein H207_3547 [Klebsiella pneumoniae UHKPC40]EOZ06837.1 hypothetical protein H240_3468 [Klebsiella pneumoniae UHKPC22]EOZ19542.1 hypothetical protein H243_3458 [Klebsiella pneumoniae UHKPC04]EPB17481.1 hypothetical protein H239_3545 [Klebsiella pneumoniae UHKPC45]EPO16152.1 hypothetical protein H217_1205 [Klebsiella pneumoniae DMC0799]
MGREIHHSLIITSQCCGAIPQAQMSFVNKKKNDFHFQSNFFYFAQSLSDDTEY